MQASRDLPGQPTAGRRRFSHKTRKLRQRWRYGGKEKGQSKVWPL